MALHVPKAPGFAQMLKDGAKVGDVESEGGGRAGLRLRRPQKACRHETGRGKVPEREACSACLAADAQHASLSSGQASHSPSRVGPSRRSKVAGSHPSSAVLSVGWRSGPALNGNWRCSLMDLGGTDEPVGARLGGCKMEGTGPGMV